MWLMRLFDWILNTEETVTNSAKTPTTCNRYEKLKWPKKIQIKIGKEEHSDIHIWLNGKTQRAREKIIWCRLFGETANVPNLLWFACVYYSLINFHNFFLLIKIYWKWKFYSSSVYHNYNTTVSFIRSMLVLYHDDDNRHRRFQFQYVTLVKMK